MRIAIPTNDGVTVSVHFGRSAGFVVFETDGGAIVGRELRANPAAHNHSEREEHHQHGEHGHNHDGIVGALAGCDVVVCAGMGQRAADALRGAGIAAVVAAPAGTPEETLRAYLDGTLQTAGGGLCRCSH
ncbi:MAG: hypothetical protein KGN36_03315 [Acidobacteriota bacterium]|nr:hypothetical protein [Acidobacteriota bacterium]